MSDPPADTIGSRARGGLVEHAPLVAVVMVYVAIIGLPARAEAWDYARLLSILAAVVPAVVVGVHLLRAAVFRRWVHWRRFVRRYARVDRVGGGVIAIALVSLLTASFLGWKPGLGAAALPFTWDARLARLDGMVHFGVAPWRLLWPLVRVPNLLWAVDLLYGVGWHLMQLSFVVWAAWSRHRRLRLQVLLTYLLAWAVLGTVVAALFPSAGPIFFDRVVPGPSPYGPLVQRILADRDLTVTIASQALWAGHMGHGPAFGISAMPSMHLAIAALAALAGWRIGPGWGVAASAFLTITMIGSVLLGWHYAVDGYVAVIGVASLWWLSGRIVRAYRRWLSRRRIPYHSTRVLPGGLDAPAGHGFSGIGGR